MGANAEPVKPLPILNENEELNPRRGSEDSEEMPPLSLNLANSDDDASPIQPIEVPTPERKHSFIPTTPLGNRKSTPRSPRSRKKSGSF